MKLFVWDFHGVLEKGNDRAVIEITNFVLKKFGFEKRLTNSLAKLLSGKKWFEYFEYLLPELDHTTHLKLQFDCFEYSKTNTQITKKYLKINDHASNVLDKIYKSPHDQLILSNTSQKALETFLELIDIKKYFFKNYIIGIDAHTNPNANKKDFLSKFLENKNYSTLITIGDSILDIELASLHENSFSYLYSYIGKPHRKCKADFKITDLRKILNEI